MLGSDVTFSPRFCICICFALSALVISFTQKFYFANLKKKECSSRLKQALVVKAMYQTAFLAREKGLNFGRWLSD